MDNQQGAAQPNEQNNTQTIFDEREFSLEGYDKHIKQARIAIFAAAGILLLNLIILYSSYGGEYEYFWIDALLWGAFIAGFIFLGFWTKKKPYTAIIAALVLYGVFILLNAIIEPATIVKGIIFKIFIIVALVKGLGDAKEAQQMKNQMGYK
jgi:peptidoglycan/LPS O-acetylase OafA/YrhL